MGIEDKCKILKLLRLKWPPSMLKSHSEIRVYSVQRSVLSNHF